MNTVARDTPRSATGARFDPIAGALLTEVGVSGAHEFMSVDPATGASQTVGSVSRDCSSGVCLSSLEFAEITDVPLPPAWLLLASAASALLAPGRRGSALSA